MVMLRGWGLWWWEDFAAVPARRRKLIAVLVIALGFFASLCLIGGLAQSKLGLTDENDLPQYVGARGTIGFSEIPRVLVTTTEVGEFGLSQRFRPTYYLLRVTETALWGLDGRAWYRWRIVMFGVVIAIMFWLYVQCTGLIFGAALTAYTLSFSMWIDIWTRSTGPSEQYAALGTAVYALGVWFFVKRWLMCGKLTAACLMMAAGAVIAMGSKENMLLLEPSLIATLGLGIWHRLIGFVGALTLVVAIAFGVWIASSIIVYFVGGKVQDIYGNSLHVSLFRSHAMIIVYRVIAVAAAAILLVAMLLRRAGKPGRLERYLAQTQIHVGFGLVILIVFVFNLAFYTGQIPTGIRYDFPALLALPALIALVLKISGDTASLFDQRAISEKITGSLLLVWMLVFAGGALLELPAAAAANVVRNSAFEASLGHAQLMTREHPDWPIYVKSFNYLDYEPIQALAFFFIARGINNPRYLVYVANPYNEPRSEFQSSLERTLTSESQAGYADRGYLPLPVTPSQQSGKCFVLVLRSNAQFASDRAAGKDPASGHDCVALPTILYWDGQILRFSDSSLPSGSPA
jgi:hypothetical protein